MTHRRVSRIPPERVVEVPTATAAPDDAPLSAVTASPTPRMHVTRTETGQCGAEC